MSTIEETMETANKEDSFIETLSMKTTAEQKVDYLKNCLNLLRARAISLGASRRVNVLVEKGITGLPAKDLEVLPAATNNVQNSLSHLLTFEKYIDKLHNNITANQILRSRDSESMEKIFELTSGIFLCYKKIIMEHKRNTEAELMKVKSEYNLHLDLYKNHLVALKNKPAQNKMEEAVKERLNKAENKLNKINIARKLKLCLISAFAKDHKKFPHLQKFRCPVGNLTLQHMIDGWDYGYRHTEDSDSE